MTQERRDELQKVCEAILGYQKGLEEFKKVAPFNNHRKDGDEH